MARSSSAASGLRFCGMIEEPVDQASLKLMKPKAADDQTTISSAMRERWVARIEAAARYSSAKSRAETESSELRVGPSKPSACAVMSRSSG